MHLGEAQMSANPFSDQSGDQLLEQYLTRAQEAEAWAGIAANATMKSQWREIANGYRNLAQARMYFAPSPIDQ